MEKEIKLLKSIGFKEIKLSSAEEIKDYIKALNKVLKKYEKLEEENIELNNNIIPGLKEEIKALKEELQEFLYWQQPNEKYTDDNYISKTVIRSKMEKLEKDLQEVTRKQRNAKDPCRKEILRVLGIRIDERIKTFHSLLKGM